jgi:hypothetical protein
VVLAAAADLGATPERFGVGACLIVVGPSILDAVIIVPDGLDEDARSHMEQWARRHRVRTPGGRRRWRLMPPEEFFDPRTGPFIQTAYSGAGWCIGADLGRVFGLTAEHIVERTGHNQGSWEIYLPGWGVPHERNRIKRSLPHRPPLRITPRRSGWQVDFGPCERGFGKYVDGHQWRGAFVDVLSLAYALDADRGASFSEHRESAGLDPFELPITVEPGAAGAARMAATVQAVHELALVLGEHA